MNDVPWMILDALQAGALVALAGSFGSDALQRRDRLMTWLALACTLLAIHHGMSILDAANVVPAERALRLKALVMPLGFLSMMEVFYALFPGAFPSFLRGTLAACMAPAMLVEAVGLQVDALVQGTRLIQAVAYAAAGLVTLRSVQVARQEGDGMADRMYGGLFVALTLLLTAFFARTFFGVDLHMAGLALLLLAISVGISWLWFITHDLHRRIGGVEGELKAWRSLFPGPCWRAGVPDPKLEEQFGADWESRLQDRIIARDGAPFKVHSLELPTGERMGWLEPLETDAATQAGPFLRGWQVGIGMEEGEELDRVQRWLENWGATVIPWGTLPPREGPYPSVLIWSREPSILAVWREYDLARRRCRWIQIGGAPIDGPHLRLDRPVYERTLREGLKKLLSLRKD